MAKDLFVFALSSLFFFILALCVVQLRGSYKCSKLIKISPNTDAKADADSDADADTNANARPHAFSVLVLLLCRLVVRTLATAVDTSNAQIFQEVIKCSNENTFNAFVISTTAIHTRWMY